MLGGRPSRRGFTQVSSATTVKIHDGLVVGNTCVQVVYSSPCVLMQGELVGVGAASHYACVCGDVCRLAVRLGVLTQVSCRVS